MTSECATCNPWGNSAKFTWFTIKLYAWSWHWKYEFLTHLNFLVCSFNKSLLTELKQQARLSGAQVCGSHTKWVLVGHPIKAVSAVTSLCPGQEAHVKCPSSEGFQELPWENHLLSFQSSFFPQKLCVYLKNTGPTMTHSCPEHRICHSELCSRDTLRALELIVRFLAEQSESTRTFFSCPWQAQRRNLS